MRLSPALLLLLLLLLLDEEAALVVILTYLRGTVLRSDALCLFPIRRGMPAPPPRSFDARRLLSALLSRAIPFPPFVDSSAAAAAAGFGRDRALLLPGAALFGGRSSTLSVWSVLPGS